ncbi:plastocyanin/azurin family copper-binding protein [Paenibacillus sp. NEAU-GSW1]|uniref:plastocyanin/azurin family copper-binding protein n=1 Tax=Paenibacillus sp. NEAU-GSW1 TaxID=2682486 RepID=UPI0012E20EC9|nr:plastocyanin/azurin family copper-binding protein [Paenibacillus sp. NEAU-GSW1]MUT64841.1 hypothetical protein [Paenibacillus sp. NEAU-GSW1]
MKTKKYGVFIFIAFLITGLLSSIVEVSAAEEPNIASDADTAAELGLLIGDGNGVNANYLSKKTTRMQAAIISLRLNGHLKEALSFAGTANFSDADKAGKANQPVLAYLKSHPEYGWSGNGDGSFKPGEAVSSQQLYKVLLENIGYRSGKDFAYKATESFAAAKGLSQIAGNSALTNAHLATALVETLTASTPNGQTFFAALQSKGVIASNASLPQGERIQLRSDAAVGTYMADKSGMTLYYFTKDAEDLNACQDQCLVNWPVYDSKQLQIPAFLNKADFTKLSRPDGTEQWMYRGYPLYYFIQDKQPGDIKGQNVGSVWYVIDPASFKGKTEANVKTYHVDIKEFSFGTEPLTVEAGSKIVFTNYDDMKHNAVAVDGSFSTPLLAKGESYTITLDKTGTHNYFCEPHKSFMTGQIIVK